MNLVSRHSFARESILSERIYSSETCRECGSMRTTPKGRTWLYRFIVDPDAGYKAPIRGLFCSRICCETYHGIDLLEG